MTTVHERRGALEAIERILNRGDDADQILRDVAAVLGRLYRYAAVQPLADETALAGPSSARARGDVSRWPVTYQGRAVGAVLVDGAAEDDADLLARVALLVGPAVAARRRDPSDG